MADICLFLEGTYPYVSGGVSTWVYDLIKRLKDKTFSIVYLGAHPVGMKNLHYPIPENVTDFRELYLFDYRIIREKKKTRSADSFKKLKEFFLDMRKLDTGSFKEILELFMDGEKRGLDMYDLTYSYEGWKILEDIYQMENEKPSFLDYFWTWRFLYLPLFSLFRLRLPEAKVYHSVSTGYAGVLGAIAKIQHNRPYILTEHGIYTRERRFEIMRADWIYEENAKNLKISEKKDFFKEWWISLFSYCSRVAYESADQIITLYEGNRQVEVAEGAPAEKTRIIPNGVDLENYGALERDLSDHPKIGFVGRVVPIKDVKTYIKAARRVCDEFPQAEFYVIGPTDEDEEYYEECRLLVEMEHLTDNVQFTGKVDVKEYYPKLDVVVLTSISEAQPLIILEAAACGVPSIATDVGACRELLFGSTADDRLIGPGGILTAMCNAKETAQAILWILKHPDEATRMGESAKKRVQTFYQMNDLIAQYDQIYSKYMEQVLWPV